MDGISYNLSAAKEVTEKMGSALGSIKNSMESEWPALVSTFQKNWVGEDEAAFEKVLAKTIFDTFENCQIVVNNASAFIIDAVNAFATFQSSLAGSMQQGEGYTIQTIDAPEKLNISVDIPVSSQTFDESTQRGLQSDGAAQELISAIESYAKSIKGKIEEEYGAIDLGTSFVGSEQRPAMEGFIHSLGESVGNLLSSVDSFINETIPGLQKAYQQQQTQVTQDASDASSSIADEVSSATGN